MAFFAFIDSCRDKEGNAFPGGLKGLADHFSPMWIRMTAEERKPYEEQANLSKGRKQKLTANGETYEEVYQEAKERAEKHVLMLSTIHSTVGNLGRRTGLVNGKFFFIHLNYFCLTGDGTYYPAEIAVSEFTIKNGMREPFHTHIDPGNLPTGYALKSQQHCNDTHRTDINQHLGEANVGKILEGIADYVGERDTLPPLYTLEKFVPSVECMLNRWADAYGKPENYFRIYHLEELFFQLKKASMKPVSERELVDGHLDQGFVYNAVAGKKLNDDPYSYRPNIGCELHEELDTVPHCSRSLVIRWGWVMCDHLCADMGVEQEPGRHGPYKTGRCYQPSLSSIEPLHYGAPRGRRKSSTASEGQRKNAAPVEVRPKPPPSIASDCSRLSDAFVDVRSKQLVSGVGRSKRIAVSALRLVEAPTIAQRLPERSEPVRQCAVQRTVECDENARPAFEPVTVQPALPSEPDQFEDDGEAFFPAMSYRRRRQRLAEFEEGRE